MADNAKRPGTSMPAAIRPPATADPAEPDFASMDPAAALRFIAAQTKKLQTDVATIMYVVVFFLVMSLIGAFAFFAILKR